MVNQVQISIDIKGRLQELRRTTDELRALGRAGSDTASRLNREFNQTRAGVEKVNQQFLSTRKLVVGLFAGLGVGNLVRDIGRAADEYTRIRGQLGLIAGDQARANGLANTTFQIAQDTREEYAGTVNTFREISDATDRIALAEQRRLGLTKIINQTLGLSFTTSQKAAGAISNFTQGLETGSINALQLTTIIKQVPALAKAIQDGLGLNLAQLKALAKEGGLTTETIIAALENQVDVIDQRFRQLPITLAQSLTRLGNAWTKFIGQTNEAAGATQNLAQLINALADNIGTVIEAALSTLQVLAAFIAGKMVASIVDWTKAQVAQLAVQRQSTLAALADAKAKAAQTAAVKAHADMLVLEAEAAVAAATGMRRLTLVETQLIPARQAARGAALQHAAAMQAATVAARASMFAMNALRSVLAFLGGPLGLIVTIATGMLLFAGNAEAATDKIAELRSEVSELTAGFESLSKAQQQNTINKQTEQIGLLQKEIEKTNKDLQDLIKYSALLNTAFDDPAIVEQQARLDGLNKELTEANKLLTELQQRQGQAGSGKKVSIIDTSNVAAEAEAGFRLLKDLNERALRDLEHRLQTHKVSLEQYYAERVRLEQQTIDAEIASLEEKLKKEVDSGQKRIEIETEIAQLQRERADIGVRAARDQARAELELQNQLAAVRVELLQSQGKNADAAAIEIEQKYKDLIATLKAQGDSAGAELVNTLIDVKKADANFRQIEQQFQQVMQNIALQEQSIQTRQEAGLINEIQARQELLQLYSDQREQLEALIPELEKYAAATGSPEAVQRAKELKVAFEALGKTVENELTNRVKGELTNGLTDFFSSVIDGTKSAKEAFRDFGQFVLQMIARIIAEQLALQTIQAAGSIFGIAHTGGVIGRTPLPTRTLPAMSIAMAPRMHTGGIAGLKSDEVPTILQAGEEVLTAGDPRHRDNIGGQGGGGVTVRNINLITQEQVAQAMSGPAGERVILNVIKMNPESIKGVLK